jgi:hypothetical protein
MASFKSETPTCFTVPVMKQAHDQKFLQTKKPGFSKKPGFWALILPENM